MNDTPNQELKDIAIKILSKSNVPKDGNHGFAVITILMIISIVLTCIRVIQECNKSKLTVISNSKDKYELYRDEIKHYSSTRGWFTKMRIKKIMRREMHRDDYNKYSTSILAAVLNTGEILTEDEVKTLVEAANA